MDSNTTKEEKGIQLSQKQETGLPELVRKFWKCRKLILKACSIVTIIGLIIALSLPKEYTASTLISPESRRSSSAIKALAGIDDMDTGSSSSDERDAIFPSLYPSIIHSTPFLVRLFAVPVREQGDSTAIPLSLYLKERQKSPWWSVITSAPSRLVGLVLSLFRSAPKEDRDIDGNGTENGTDIFHLSREEAGLAGAISSRIHIGVDKKKRTVTISVTMQDPQVAATVADTVQSRLKEYITSYRTAKARRMLEFAEGLRREAQAEYHAAQERYTRYADANRGLTKLASRAELARLRNEMNLAASAYNRAERQVQSAMAKVEKVRPVYAVIQPVMVPLSPSKPRKMVILAVCILLGGAGSVGWVLFGKKFLDGFKEAWKKEGEKNKEKGYFQ